MIKENELTLEGIAQYYILIEKEELKFDTLNDLFKKLNISRTIIYMNTGKKAEFISKRLNSKEFVVRFIDGLMNPSQRESIINEFRTGSTRVLASNELLDR